MRSAWTLISLVVLAGSAGLALAAAKDDAAPSRRGEAEGLVATFIERHDVDALRRARQVDARAVLDLLLPKGTDADVGDPDVAAVLAPLGAGAPAAREAATQALLGQRQQYRAVAAGLRHPSPEVRARCVTIWGTWQDAVARQGGWPPYMMSVDGQQPAPDPHLRPPMLAHARRAIVAQPDGKDSQFPDRHFWALAAVRLAAPNDRSSEVNHDEAMAFLPLLDGLDERSAASIVATLGSRYGGFPEVAERGLNDARPRVVDAAMNCGCRNDWPADARHRLHEGLLRRLAGGNADLRDSAAFYLMHTFGDSRGPAYLCRQLPHADAEHQRTYLLWLGDSCNRGRPFPTELARALTPFVSDADAELRAAAAEALGPYPAADTRALLAALARDHEPAVRQAAAMELMRDEQSAVFVLPLLTDADEGVKQAVRTFLGYQLGNLGPDDRRRWVATFRRAAQRAGDPALTDAVDELAAEVAR